MSRTEILKNIQEIICDVLDDETIQITEETAVNDIKDWDSVAHMTIMAMIENEFGIQMDINEIVKVKTIKEMLNSVENAL
jgi:acyl carrier protein